MWEELYTELKSGRYGSVREIKGHNPLNAAILSGAPGKVLKIMIELGGKELLMAQSHKSKNVTLHYLLGTPVSNSETKKEIDHSLVRLVIRLAPESFYVKNANGVLPINMITEANYNELRLIFEDSIIAEDGERLNTIFHNMPFFILNRLLDDGIKYVNKNKIKIPRYRAMLDTFEAMKIQIKEIKVEVNHSKAQKNADDLLKQEQKEKLKEQKRAEIAERVRLARVEQERKHLAALQIQKGYRGTLERRKYQEYLKQKGLNKKAIPFIPNQKRKNDEEEILSLLPRSIDQVTLNHVLPLDAEVKHPWRPVKDHWKTFQFGSSNVQTLEKDLKKVLSV
jgi:hypothetical protein